MPKSKSTFTLKGVYDVKDIIEGYSTTGYTKKVIQKDSSSDDIPQRLIDVDVKETEEKESKKVYYFLDPRKIKLKYVGIMLDVTSNGSLPVTTTRPCWWCRSSFKTTPIGCPLVYHSQKHSGIDKQYIEEKFKLANFPTDTNDFFETEGIFCSFPCCKSYILDQESIKYKNSLSLLSMMYIIFYGENKEPIVCAPSWKMLIDYGGSLTPEEFRKTFGKLSYVETVNLRRPYLFCSSQYIEEKKVRLFKDGKN